MGFEVAAEAYGMFMGRYSEPLADGLVDLLPTTVTRPVLDVGCGPGAMTSRLVDRWGTGRVSAVDPSASFVGALADRIPGIDVRTGRAEALPWAADTFAVVTASLVVHFLPDPAAGFREMVRVAAPGGTVAATVWDHAGGRGPLALFWDEARALHPGVEDESGRAGTGAGQLATLARGAGLTLVADTELTVSVTYEDVEQWWRPYTLGVGPAGDHLGRLSPGDRTVLHDRCAARLPVGPFVVTATAWCVVGRR
ncbi:SAM-dependent methyltransferase [Nakamurella flavida]|uniref:class I SAM-dependent methyltransferase n=1 Tax=Nakamurella flavida TaxID=363630 RepID=UPI002785B4AA|nr:class I SAM-dependent methyltransferase [Nakamurella flavida]MDP9778531.1 SAM-dependent methyltransferase [Nakamurella flavida]